MRYDFVQRHRDRWPARAMCRALRVRPAGYHDRRGGRGSPEAERREAPVVAIKAVHAEGEGPPRQPGDPRRAGRPRESPPRGCRGPAGASGGGGAAEARRRSRVATGSNRDRPAAEGVLDRRSVPAANRARTADIADIATGRGWPYPAAVGGLHPRRILGWSTGTRADGRLAVDALEMAPAGRPPGGGLVAHSGRGGQHASEHHQGTPARHGIARGMGRRANCWGNAPAGSSSAPPRKGPTRGGPFAARARARAELFEPIEALLRPGPASSVAGLRATE